MRYLVTFTEMAIDHPACARTAAVAAELLVARPLTSPSSPCPRSVGARADQRIPQRSTFPEVLDFLGIPDGARHVVSSAFAGSPRTYVEIVAGEHRDGPHVTTDVGVSIVDCVQARILVSPMRGL